MSDPFRRRTRTALIVGAAISFAAFLALSVFQEELKSVRSSGNDSYSLSALGHLAWVDVLDEIGVPVVVRRERRAVPDPGALVVAAEPASDADGIRRLQLVLERAGHALVVLPKWVGVESPYTRREVTFVRPMDRTLVQSVMSAAGLTGTLARVEGREAPSHWQGDVLHGVPDTQHMQLVTEGLEPVLWCDQGVLVGRLPDDPDTWVLTDPDVIANHGLRRGDNAALSAQLVDAARDGGVVIVDETIHGHGIERSMWRELFEFPLVLVLLHGAIALGAALWAGAVRFGSPRPVEPALAPGRATLVENTASLLLYGGRSHMLLGRYLERATDDVAAAHGSRPDATRGERAEVVQRAAAGRDALHELESLTEAVRACVRDETPSRRGAEQRALALARRIHHWRGEILDGHPTGGHDRRRDS